MNAKDAIVQFLPHVKMYSQLEGRTLNLPVEKIVQFMEDYASLKMNELPKHDPVYPKGSSSLKKEVLRDVTI